jgi:MFS family permease
MNDSGGENDLVPRSAGFAFATSPTLRKFGARWWLGTAVLLWGIVMIGMGFAPTWQSLAAMRAVLGLFESALFPGAAYLISCWYPRKDMAMRNVTFYIAAAVAGSFAKPLGYAFSLLHGRAGRSGVSATF